MNTQKYTLTIGLNDKDTKQQKYDIITCYKLVEDILKKYLDGYTIYEAKGGYKHDDGTFISENSLVVMLLFTNDIQVKIIVDTIKQVLNQESVAVVKETIKSELW